MLVGDSLGMVVATHDGTVPVPLDMAYDTHCAARGNEHAWIIEGICSLAATTRPPIRNCVTLARMEALRRL